MPPQSSLLDGPRAWWRLLFAIIIGTIGNAGMWTAIVIMPHVERDFALGRAETSMIFVVTMLGFSLGNPLAGRMTDRMGVVPTLLASALLGGGGHVLVGLAPGMALVIIGQALIGLGAAGSMAPLIADISHWFRKRRGIAMSLAATASYFAGVFWPMALRYAIGDVSWQTAYVLVGVFILVSMPPLTLLQRERLPLELLLNPAPLARKAGPVVRGGPAVPGVSPGRLTALLFVAGIACCVAMAMPQVHIVAYCTDLGYGPAVGAEMLALMLMGGVVSRLIGGFFSDQFGGLRTLLLYGSAQMFALLLYIPFDGLAPLYVVSLIFGLSQGGLVPAYAVIVREYLPANVAGSRVGLVMAATTLGMALGGWMSGWIHDLTQSYMLAFLNGIAWNGLNVGIALWLMWRMGQLPIPPRRPQATVTA